MIQSVYHVSSNYSVQSQSMISGSLKMYKDKFTADFMMDVTQLHQQILKLGCRVENILVLFYIIFTRNAKLNT